MIPRTTTRFGLGRMFSTFVSGRQPSSRDGAGAGPRGPKTSFLEKTGRTPARSRRESMRRSSERPWIISTAS